MQLGRVQNVFHQISHLFVQLSVCGPFLNELVAQSDERAGRTLEKHNSASETVLQLEKGVNAQQSDVRLREASAGALNTLLELDPSGREKVDIDLSLILRLAISDLISDWPYLIFSPVCLLPKQCLLEVGQR